VFSIIVNFSRVVYVVISILIVSYFINFKGGEKRWYMEVESGIKVVFFVVDCQERLLMRAEKSIFKKFEENHSTEDQEILEIYI